MVRFCIRGERHGGSPARAGRYVAVVEAKVQTRQEKRDKRHKRVRNKVSGTPERPRLAVFRSHQHIYAQVVCDPRWGGGHAWLRPRAG